MEIKSTSECLNRIDNMIFDRSLKYMVIDDLELFRNHIEWQQADALAKKEYIEERIVLLSVLSQINHIIERFFSDDTEEELDEQYNKLRLRILEWYETINTQPEKKLYFK